MGPIRDLRCPEGSRKLKFPDYVTLAQDGGKVVSLTLRPLLYPQENSVINLHVIISQTLHAAIRLNMRVEN